MSSLKARRSSASSSSRRSIPSSEAWPPPDKSTPLGAAVVRVGPPFEDVQGDQLVDELAGRLLTHTHGRGEVREPGSGKRKVRINRHMTGSKVRPPSRLAQQALDWPFVRILMAHGNPITEDARGTLRTACRWMLAAQEG